MRELTAADAEEFAAHVAADLSRLREFLPWPERTDTPEGAAAWLQPYADQEDGRVVCQGIEVDGALVGGMVLFHHDPVLATAEIGCWIVAGHEGKGLVRTACLDGIRRARELGVQRLVWQCDPRNTRSRRLAERLGFTYEGTLRSSYVVRGERLDTAVFSLVGGEIEEALAHGPG